MSLLIIGILIYLNVRLALAKGRNPYTWGFLSLLGFFAALFTVLLVYLLAIYDGPINGPEASKMAVTHLTQKPLTSLMIEMLGVGGMLLVRFILERSTRGNDTGPEKQG